jgi:hypothetical protein
MVYLFLLGYILIMGSVFMDDDSEIREARELITRRLKPLGIDVDMTLHCNGNISVTATKRHGLSIKHVCIEGTNLIETLSRLIKYIEQNISDWIKEAEYGQV